MRCQILHESSGRIRVHMMQYRMTMDQADILEYYLKRIDGVSDATVSERTGNAVICFRQDDRDTIISALSSFSYEENRSLVPENTGRQISHEFQDRITWHVVRRGLTRFLLPLPVRMVITIAHAVPYIVDGIRTLLTHGLQVPVLDMASITVSLLQGNFDTAGDIMFLLGLSEILEEWTHKKSVDDLARSMALNIDKVWLRTADGVDVLVPIEDVQTDDQIVVRTGSTIPLDGFVAEGEASVNQASLTGESMPVRKKHGDPVYAGTVLEEGECVIKITKAAGSGRYDSIVKMIEDSEKLKSEAEHAASELADRLVPWCFAATGLTYLLTQNVTRAVSVLMVDFSCALKLSIPIAVLSAMREASNYHISVKGGKYLEAVAQADTIVFDKTGTLTCSQPRVAMVVPFNGQDEKEMLRLAACLEEHYPHSIASAVVKAASDQGLTHDEKHSEVQYVVAHGIASHIDGQKIVIGSAHFIFEDEGCVIPEGEQEKFAAIPEEYSHLYMAESGVLCAVICIEDPIRKQAPAVIQKLHELGIEKEVMMTGDSERTARAVAALVGVDEYHSEVLPEDKAAFVNTEHAKGRKVIMIGDGINDTPALSAADAAVAISDGAAIAREVADITLAGNDLESLVTMRELSDELMKRIHQNYAMILGINSTLIALGMLGILTPALTAYMHNFSTLAISLHSMTPLLPKNDQNPCIETRNAYTES